MGNSEIKQRPFMPLIGRHGKPDIGLGLILAFILKQLQTGHISHLCFGMLVGRKPASASKHKQDNAKRQNQHYCIVVLELAGDWSLTDHMKRLPQ